MRNLKRVLSLAMASVMLLGMMVIGAGAADKKPLSDLDKVNNKEAVNLMVDLGIIVGKPDGSFAPAELVNRATMAKLITYIMMGDINPDLFAGVSTDLKDIDNNWAKGFIKFCYSNGVITGDGLGSFYPDNDVTLVQAAKMLLVAIGYDAEVQGYVGSSWSVNIMRDAKQAGLLEGISVGTNEKLTRDNASQMIFNALFARTVTYGVQWDGGKAYKANPTTAGNPTLGAQQYSLVKKASGVLNANEANSGSSLKGKSNIIGQGTVSVASSIEDIGKSVYYYTFTKDGKSNVPSSNVVVDKDVRVVSVPDNLVASSPASGEKLASSWLSENGLREHATADTLAYSNYFVDSDINNGSLAAALIAVTSGDTAYAIDNNDDGVIDVLVVNTLTVKKVTGDVKTNTTSSTTTVYVPGVLTGYTNVNNVVGYEGLQKDDVVFTLTVNGSITYISKAESINGTITGYKASPATIYVDGDAHEISPIAGSISYADVKALGTKDEATFWLDAEGNIVFAKGVKAVASSSLALMVGYSYTGGDGVNDVAASARLVLSDGTTQVVKVSKDSTYLPVTNVITNNAVNTFKYVSYTINADGEYVLEDAGTMSKYTVSAALSSRHITTGSANYVMGTAATTGGFVGNGDTVFVVANWNSANTQITSYSVYKGIANAPAYNGSAAGYVVSEGGTAKLVFVTGGTQISSGDAVYLYTEKYTGAIYNAVDKTYTIEAYLDGVKDNIVVSDKVYNVTLTGNGLYKVDVTDGVVTGATASSLGATITGLTYSAGTIGDGTNYYATNDKTVVFYKDGTVLTTIARGDIKSDTNDTVRIVANSKGVAEIIYITKVDMTGTWASAVSAEQYGKTTAGTTLSTDVAATGWANNDVLQITATAAANLKVTVKIDGAGTDATVSATGATATADYTLVAADLTGNIVVTITVTDGTTEMVHTYNFTLTA